MVKNNMDTIKPILVKDVEYFTKKNKVLETIDKYEEILEDLFLIRNPQFKMNPDYKDSFEVFKKEHTPEGDLTRAGNWFYFPWNGRLVHYLSDEMHQEVRTARNKNIILKDEQEKLYNAKIGVAGLSVGSHGVLTMTMMGMAKHIKIADPDVISASNLNRIRYDYTKIGRNKAEVAAEYIYQMNPYSEVELFTEGITEGNIDEFLSDIDVLVEEMDNLAMKIHIRDRARKKHIPVIMATDNGDNVIFDIERYDLDLDLKIFNGVAGNLTLEEFKKIKPEDMPKLATKIAGADMVVPRMLMSLKEVGKTLYSWPQTGDAATLAGITIAHVVKRLILGEPLKTGKLDVNIDRIFDPNYDSKKSIRERQKIRTAFKKGVGLE